MPTTVIHASALHSFIQNSRPWLFCLLIAHLSGAGLSAADFSDQAARTKTQLATKVMPYWYDTGVDRANGGYLLADDGRGKGGAATEKQLVTQARMVWGFSHAYLHGFRNKERDYLQAARGGYEFLLAHFLDREHGGYFWTTDPQGKVLNPRKIVYGQSFVIYGLVEYYRASGDKAALGHALDLYQALQKHSHDDKHRGWIEHFERDWRPILKPGPEAIVEVGGYKSANTHLHLMEAFTELYAVTRNDAVRVSLQEALDLNAKYFYPRDPGKSAFHFQLDWQPVTAASSAGLSYGHNVEFAWLMVHAQQTLGATPDWAHFDAILDHALKYGYDHQRGGLYNRGFDNQPATDTDKVWWVQAEMLAALTDGLGHNPNPAYEQALASLLAFVSRYQANPTDGIWLDTVKADGTPKTAAKAHNWKANYHDVRALVKFVEQFGVGGKSR